MSEHELEDFEFDLRESGISNDEIEKFKAAVRQLRQTKAASKQQQEDAQKRQAAERDLSEYLVTLGVPLRSLKALPKGLAAVGVERHDLEHCSEEDLAEIVGELRQTGSAGTTEIELFKRGESCEFWFIRASYICSLPEDALPDEQPWT